MLPEYLFYLAAIPAVLITGISKGGFANGLGVIGVPLMALAVDPLRAAAIMLPVLIAMDAVSLVSWRRHVQWSVIRYMLPGGFAGLGLGWATAAFVPEPMVRILVGVIAIAFAVSRVLADRRQTPARPESMVRASIWGTIAGYTSFVSHAGGPPYQAYTLPLRMDKLLFAGTSVVFFAVLNAAKVVPYLALGQFDRANLLASLSLLPLAVIGVRIGVWAVRRVSQGVFYNVTYAALVLVGCKLVWDGARALS